MIYINYELSKTNFIIDNKSLSVVWFFDETSLIFDQPCSQGYRDLRQIMFTRVVHQNIKEVNRAIF